MKRIRSNVHHVSQVTFQEKNVQSFTRSFLLKIPQSIEDCYKSPKI